MCEREREKGKEKEDGFPPWGLEDKREMR